MGWVVFLKTLDGFEDQVVPLTESFAIWSLNKSYLGYFDAASFGNDRMVGSEVWRKEDHIVGCF